MAKSTKNKPTGIALPDRDFVAVAANWKGSLFNCKDSLKIEPSLEDKVLASTPLKDVGWSHLFAYMHRRFGPPHVGGDDYKDLSAGWMLTTPNPDLFIRVFPSLSGAGFSLGPYLSQAQATRNRYGEMLVSADVIEPLKKAYRTGLLDLLRPVCVRDSNINALGEVDDGSPLLEYDDNEDEHLYGAERHIGSGQPMPLGLFGGPDWVSLCTMMVQLGNGDMQAGRSAVIEILREKAFEEAAQLSDDVKRIMLMSNLASPELLQDGLKLSKKDCDRLVGEGTVLFRFNSQKRTANQRLTIKTGDLDTALKFLARLGLPAPHLRELCKAVQVDGCAQDSFEELKKINGKQELPEEAMRFDPTSGKAAIADHMRKAFNAAKRPELTAWLGATMDKEHGPKAFEIIAHHLRGMLEEQEKKNSRKKSKQP